MSCQLDFIAYVGNRKMYMVGQCHSDELVSNTMLNTSESHDTVNKLHQSRKLKRNTTKVDVKHGNNDKLQDIKGEVNF